jgi:nucleosome binding factor SPN SPT16 subunit
MTMLLTPEKFYFATSAAKGISLITRLTVAKHLETLVTKEGVPLEILKRTKDEEINRKTFSDITDAIKSSGVVSRKSFLIVEKGGNFSQG